ncbi:MAG: hypothetical protein CLLPBCKN_006455 [Chroococcidiopsis cubana SAG 39.79]|uniref:CopG-like ribbon-helix-helix domain-containing protein n=1 Tax=Chroococcidiopsis cubana SAG 39.79 TaxID=388085 RepID=A0AB37UGW5_9CYAN|nr:hypothetical protein [Chroococcidiopsis cubana]MDZ4877020.1 hypothetical protein [Chroococcidiopsis cubana SAG 39.79]PSB51664.1 hypothetical protein C7B79_36185 [Chroococcidiopsis cubana CCALA 043]RUT10763.1 hypothetical protein DSM107010_40030 [Chroococcidiopsis cubana SAG 39.79]
MAIPRVPKTEDQWLKEGAAKQDEFKTPLRERKKRQKKDLEPVLVRVPRDLHQRMMRLIDSSGTGIPTSHWIVEAIRRRVEEDEKAED